MQTDYKKNYMIMSIDGKVGVDNSLSTLILKKINESWIKKNSS